MNQIICLSPLIFEYSILKVTDSVRSWFSSWISLNLRWIIICHIFKVYRPFQDNCGTNILGGQMWSQVDIIVKQPLSVMLFCLKMQEDVAFCSLPPPPLDDYCACINDSTPVLQLSRISQLYIYIHVIIVKVKLKPPWSYAHFNYSDSTCFDATVFYMYVVTIINYLHI